MPRRYATAQALADDLRRYLDGRPILARPVGHWEHTWRWCRRNPVVAGLSTALLFALLAGMSAATYFAVKERHRADESNANAVRAEENSRAALEYAAKLQLSEAEARANAKKAIDARALAEESARQAKESQRQAEVMAQKVINARVDALLPTAQFSEEDISYLELQVRTASENLELEKRMLQAGQAAVFEIWEPEAVLCIARGRVAWAKGDLLQCQWEYDDAVAAWKEAVKGNIQRYQIDPDADIKDVRATEAQSAETQLCASKVRGRIAREAKNAQLREGVEKAKELAAAPTATTTSFRLLTKDAQAGTWSPDGRRIAFTHVEQLENGLRILTLADNTIEELTKTGKDPAWSPGEGRFIAFTDTRAGDKAEGIWILDLSSKQTKRVATGGFAGWLADGKTVCYTTTNGVQSLDVTDENARPKTLQHVLAHISAPAVAPDGKSFAGFYAGGGLMVGRLQGANSYYTRPDFHPLPNSIGVSPSWSPDSQRVGFGLWYAQVERNGLWIYDLRTRQAQELLAGPYTLPRWSPDGKRMCVDKRGASPPEMWLLDLKPSPATEEKPAAPPKDLSGGNHASRRKNE